MRRNVHTRNRAPLPRPFGAPRPPWPPRQPRPRTWCSRPSGCSAGRSTCPSAGYPTSGRARLSFTCPTSTPASFPPTSGHCGRWSTGPVRSLPTSCSSPATSWATAAVACAALSYSPTCDRLSERSRSQATTNTAWAKAPSPVPVMPRIFGRRRASPSCRIAVPWSEPAAQRPPGETRQRYTTRHLRRGLPQWWLRPPRRTIARHPPGSVLPPSPTVPSDAFPILLIHEPPPPCSPLAERFSLAFAGHTHGGQLRVPESTGPHTSERGARHAPRRALRLGTRVSRCLTRHRHQLRAPAPVDQAGSDPLAIGINLDACPPTQTRTGGNG